MQIQKRMEIESLLVSHHRMSTALNLKDQEVMLRDFIGKTSRIFSVDNIFALSVSSRNLIVEKYYTSSEGKKTKLLPQTNLIDFSWAMPKLLNGVGLMVFAIETLPENAKVEQRLFQRRGWKTLMVLPMKQDHCLQGLVGFAFSNISVTDSAWDADELHWLKIIAAMIGSCLRQIYMHVELLQERGRWELLAKCSHDILWDWDMHRNQVCYFGNAPEDWTVWVNEVQSQAGNAFLQRVHPDDLPELKELLLRHWRQKEAMYLASFRLMHRDGTYHPVLSKGTTRYNESGQPIRMVGSTTDIKIITATQAVIRRQNDILNQTHEGVMVTDLEGILNYWNNSAEKLTGYSSEEVLGKKADILSPAKENLRIRFENVFQKVRIRGAFDLDVLIRKKSGDVFLGHLFATLLKNEKGEPYAVVAYLTAQANRNSNKSELQKMMTRQKKNDLIRILLAEHDLSKQEVGKMLQLADLENGKQSVCTVIFIASLHGKKPLHIHQDMLIFRDVLNRILDLCEPEGSIAWSGHDMVGLIQTIETSTKIKVQSKADQRTVSNLIQKMENEISGLKVSAGVSRSFTQWQELPRAYQEAEQAARLGDRIYGPGHYCYDEIGVYGILQQLIGKTSTEKFVKQTLGVLTEYDQKRKPWMFRTLEILLAAECSKSAAGILGIHPKTLSFRHKRIEKLLGISLDDPQTRMKLSIAVALQKLID